MMSQHERWKCVKKRFFLCATLALALAVAAVLAVAPVAAARANAQTFGQVISAINHTSASMAALQQTSGIALDQVTLVDVTTLIPPNPVVPPNPIIPPTPIRAFHNAIAQNAQDILTLRQTLPGVQLTSITCDLCSTSIGGLLEQRNVSLDSVATAAFDGSHLTIYFTPTDPCVQDPLNACRDS
jgi:hypothetical protein